MTNLRCSRVAVLALMSLAGCADQGRDWPTLMTAQELRTGKPDSALAMAQATTAAPAEVPAVVAPGSTAEPTEAPKAGNTALIRAEISRLAEARRDVRAIKERWTKQQLVLATIAAGIQSKGPADTQWNKAQSELTKLNQIAAEWDDLETVVNKVTGQLAIGAHQGGDVSAPLAESGALLTEIEAAKSEATRAKDAIRRKISR